MGHPSSPPANESLDDFVEAFETAQASRREVELAEFLPPAGHPLYLGVLRELVRVDLEYRWQQGKPERLESYRERFPDLFADRTSLNEVTFEEFRLRQQAGEKVTPSEYERRFGVNPVDWPLTPEATRTPLPTRDHSQPRPPSETSGEPWLEAWLDNPAGELPTLLLRNGPVLDSDQADPVPLGAAFPEPGSKYLGFDLLEELGHGAFGRVYLARQDDLAARPVALKVTARRFDEARTLARLQHSHIVPIYSVHSAGALQAVCMPYLGATTLADILRELRREGGLPSSGKALVSTVNARRRSTLRADQAGPLPAAELASPSSEAEAVALRNLGETGYVTAVLRLGEQLASGLAHAHERGIIHRDLKPANVLLTDDGRAMLLDFNLAVDVETEGVSSALVGGTLPYMAPEHLELFAHGRGSVDGRGDVYALGVILYELLAGRLPFEVSAGSRSTFLARACADRRRQPASLRRFNGEVTPAIESIIRRCLEPDPDRRYGNARELQEDLQAQLSHQPLLHAREPSLVERARKWYRRHPRLTVGLSVAVVAATLLAVAVDRLAQERGANALLNAAATRGRFQDEMKEAQINVLDSLDAGPEQRARARADCERVLATYQVLNDPAWFDVPQVRRLSATEQARLREEVGELLLLWARAVIQEGPEHRAEALKLNALAAACFPADAVPATVQRQHAALAGDRPSPPLDMRAADSLSPRELALAATDLTLRRDFAGAQQLLERAARGEPQQFTLWLDLAICHEHQANLERAAASYDTCIALAPKLASLYLRRAVVRLNQKRPAEALADLNRTLELRPDLADAYLHRALALAGLQKYAPAIADVTQAIQLGSPPVRAYLIRAQLHADAGNASAAERDRTEGFRHPPVGEACWVARGSSRVLPKETEVALQDFEEALKLNPYSYLAFENKAYLLAEPLGRPADAVKVLTTAVERFPENGLMRCNRGVLLARQGDRAGALADAGTALKLDRDPAVVYRVACIHALTAKDADDRAEALRILGDALRQGFGRDLVENDPDLTPLRNTAEFKRLVKQAVPAKVGS